MSEPTPPARSGGNVFTRKIGPLPMWGWVAIVGGGLVVYELWKNKSQSSTAADSTTAADVPQFVNQTYVSTAPPMNTGPGTATPVVPGGVTAAGGAGAPHGGRIGPEKPKGKGPGASPKRLEASGNESWTQIAKANGTTVANIKAATSTSPLDPAARAAVSASIGTPGRKPPRGTVFYA